MASLFPDDAELKKAAAPPSKPPPNRFGWPAAILGPKPAKQGPGPDPCSRQPVGKLPRNWIVGPSIHQDDDGPGAAATAQATLPAEGEGEAGQRDGFQFDSEEMLYTQEQLQLARSRMKVHGYDGRGEGCTCSYSYKRETKTMLQDKSFSFALKAHNQLQGWFVWEGPTRSEPLTAQICPMRGGWMIRHVKHTEPIKSQAVGEDNTRLVFSAKSLWTDLRSAKKTGDGNPLADSMRSREHELYELRILARDKLIDTRLFQVTDEQEIVMAGARSSGRERRQKRAFSPERLGMGEKSARQEEGDAGGPADGWECVNCSAHNAPAASYCGQCDESRATAAAMIAGLQARPMQTDEQPPPMAVGYDARFASMAKVTGTRAESISAAFGCLGAHGLLEGTVAVTPRAATKDELELGHDTAFLNAHDHSLPGASAEDESASLEDALEAMEDQAAVKLTVAQASALAAGTVIDMAKTIAGGKATNGVALVRPCGSDIDHKGEPRGAVNVLAIAARAAVRNGAKRVFVLDWSVAHGIGTQRICYDDPAVMTFSIHGTSDRQQRAWVQCDDASCRKWRKLPVGCDAPTSGKWFCSMNPDKSCDRCSAPAEWKEGDPDEEGPSSGDDPKESDAETVGPEGERAEGKTANLTWTANSMTDADYYLATSKLLLPILQEFCPDVVLVGSRFDAGQYARRKDEPSGYDALSPVGFAHVLAMMQTAAPGRILLVCEGGNNIRATCDSLAWSVRVLRGESPPQPLPGGKPTVESVQAVSFTADQLEQFWRALQHADGDNGADEPEGHPAAAAAAAGPVKRANIEVRAADSTQLGMEIRQLQLQLHLQGAGHGSQGQIRVPIKLIDGRAGWILRSGHGYVRVELASGGLINTRASEIVGGAATVTAALGSSNAPLPPSRSFVKGETVFCAACQGKARASGQSYALKCSNCAFIITPLNQAHEVAKARAEAKAEQQRAKAAAAAAAAKAKAKAAQAKAAQAKAAQAKAAQIKAAQTKAAQAKAVPAPKGSTETLESILELPLDLIR